MDRDLRGLIIPEGYYKPRKIRDLPASLHGRDKVYLSKVGNPVPDGRYIFGVYTDASKRYRLYTYYSDSVNKVLDIPKEIIEKHRALVYKKEAQKFIRVGSGLLAKLGGASGERAALREVINDIKKVI